MKRFFTVALLGVAALGLAADQASAGWLRSFCCRKKCYVTIQCKQYNAFSPYCCDGMGGACPFGHGGNHGAWFSDGAGYLGELPAAVNGDYVTSPTPLPEGAGRAVAPGTAAPPAQVWSLNPSGVPSYYPGYAGQVPQVSGR